MNEMIKFANETTYPLYEANAIVEADRTLYATIQKGDLTAETLKEVLSDESAIYEIECVNEDGTVLQTYSGYVKASDEIVVADEYITFTLMKVSVDDVDALARTNQSNIDYISAMADIEL